ncbi:SWIM zinc finger family protein [Prauserella sp. ASG 168]|uniref:SWIM zinc finger family protein n=1 Tax=Prauserella cavernicola TaxID=2800127 RepID=A0A934QNP0_9PSEU|nr:SWIM zinc finger family protein [Prauserella cavernicola]
MLRLAPDSASAKAARTLARPATWSALGSTESLVWGKCQGSAREPYQVTVDLHEPAFRCTCPSRKFPCKHGLALLLLWAANDGTVTDLDEASGFAADWAHERAERAAKAASRAASTPDPEAAAKRQADRESLMSAGLDEFERWLFDLVRQGLAGVRAQPAGFWETAAARLVDAQVPGLAERVRALGAEVHVRTDWAEHVLGRVGRWFLAVRAWRRRASLSAAELGDLRALLGWARRSDEVLAGERVADRWWVLGLRQDEDERLLSQRTWLYGERTGQMVVLLDFAAAGGALRVPHVLGSVLDGELALYPGAEPRRALLAGEVTTATGDGLPVADSVTAALERSASWLAANPWLERIPLALRAVTVVPDEDGTVLVDNEGHALPLERGADVWPLLALSGGHPVDLFGEWIDERVHPCSLVAGGRLVAV